MAKNKIEIGDLVKIVGIEMDATKSLKDVLKRSMNKNGEISYIGMGPNEKLPAKLGLITRILYPYNNRKHIVYEFLCGENLYFTRTVSYFKKINSTENETIEI